jgi:hypothetical protein
MPATRVLVTSAHKAGDKDNLMLTSKSFSIKTHKLEAFLKKVVKSSVVSKAKLIGND